MREASGVCREIQSAPLQAAYPSVNRLTCSCRSRWRKHRTKYTYDAAGRIIGADYGANNTTSYTYDNAGNLLQTASPQPAIWATPISRTQLLLVWPMFTAGFVLESTASLTPPTLWTPVSPGPTSIVNQQMVTVTNSTGNQFVRLQK